MRTYTAQQTAVRDAILAGLGNLVVIARAGTGKTSTIEWCVHELRAAKPRLQVAVMAFNTAIRDELAQRIPQQVADVLSLHSYGNKQLCRACGLVPLAKDKYRKIAEQIVPKVSPGSRGYDKDQAERDAELCESIVKAADLARNMLATTPEQIDEIIDRFQIIPPEFEEERPGFILRVLQAIEIGRGQILRREVIDFTDQIWAPVAMNLRQRQYDVVLVDETQDLNAAQIELVLRACKRGGFAVAVGDPAQSIYGFRGADAEAIPNIIRRLGAATLGLSVTFRCCRAVVREANKVVEDFEAAPGAPEGLVAECSMAKLVAEVAPGDFVLSRTNAPLTRLCMALLKQGKRAKIQGRDIGTKLAGIVKRTRAATMEELVVKVAEWRDSECKRLAVLERDTTATEDTAEAIFSVASGAREPAEVVLRLESLFADGDDSSRIVLSTTHKAKGLERERVWLLRDTYTRQPRSGGEPTQEEQNLYYVAVTRAKRELWLVRGEVPEEQR